MRWHHPERGPIPPDELLAIAEDIGLMAEIGVWTLQQACAQAARWPAPINVAINVSSLQFLHRNLTESVLQALAQSGLSPHRLELEIAESLLQENPNTLAILHQLRQLGVRIAMDGFGTGHCSLSGLRAFPFDKIKIDKAFIADVERSEEIARHRPGRDRARDQPRHGHGGGRHRGVRSADQAAQLGLQVWPGLPARPAA